VGCFCMQAASERVETCEHLVTECHRSSEPLKSACSPSAFVKVSKQLGELDSALDDVRLSAENSTAERELETYHVDNYDNMLQVTMLLLLLSWLHISALRTCIAVYISFLVTVECV